MGKGSDDEEFLGKLTELFLAEGISSLTVAEIAGRLRCSRRRLYEVASTKEELFYAIARRHFGRVLDKGEDVSRETGDLPRVIATYLEIGAEASNRFSMQFMRDLDGSEQGRAIFDEYQVKRTMRLCELIDSGVASGVFVACHGLVVAEFIRGGARRIRDPDFLARAGVSITDAFHEFYRVLLGGLLLDKATAPVVYRTASSANNSTKAQ
jgi:AcrR family transcriptional regulator